jgi:hypothetical protein
MRRATTIPTVTVLILAGVIVKGMVAPSKTIADTTARESRPGFDRVTSVSCRHLHLWRITCR